MCDTRWVERHELISRFVEMYIPVVHALGELEESARVETSKQAHQLLNVVTRGTFVLAVIVAEKFFGHTLLLCTALQKVSCDLAECCRIVNCVIEVFTDMRTNAQTNFNEMFRSAQQSAAMTLLSQGLLVVRRIETMFQLQMQMSIIACHRLYHSWISLSVNFSPDSVSMLIYCHLYKQSCHNTVTK